MAFKNCPEPKFTTGGRQAQTAYSDLQPRMHDEHGRRVKARKMRATLEHFLGRTDLSGLALLDVGSSTGYISDELARAGADVVGLDIDVPGLAKAATTFGDRIGFLCGDGARMPFRDGTFDVVIFNQIYEHVVDPDAVVAEIHRVLRPGGVVYLGYTNRLVPVEPHYRLPLLSWLPAGLSDRYVRRFGGADRYHERLKTYPGLRRMSHAFELWDYTVAMLRQPGRFAADDSVPGLGTRVPPAVYRALYPVLPGYVWIGVKGAGAPAGAPLAPGPFRLSPAET
jgi:SAM-dependent methyltransferase